MSSIRRFLVCTVSILILLPMAACAADGPSATRAQTPSEAVDVRPQSDKPFTDADVFSLIREDATIGDVAALIGAQSVGMEFYGEATGESGLILNFHGNSATLLTIAPEDGISGESWNENQTPDTLPPELLTEKAILIGAVWRDAEFSLPTIRGVDVGASEGDVLRAFLCADAQGEIIYGIDALNPLADESWASDFVGARRYEEEHGGEHAQGIEYVFSDVADEDEWRIYYSLFYEIVDGNVKSIRLSYFTDPE